MARTKISEFSATPGDNTDIDGIDIAEGCAPSGINNAIRELMAQLKDMQTGTSGDTFTLTTVNSTTVDTTNLEATNLKAKDGTAAGSIANTTGVVTLASSVLTTADINGGTVDGTTIGASSASTGAFTTLASNGATTFTAGTASTSTTTGTAVITGGLGVSGRINAANFDGIVGANTAAAVSSTNLAYTGTLTGGTGVIAIGTNQIYKDASGNVGLGTASPTAKLDVLGSSSVVAQFVGNNANNYIQLSDNNGTNLCSVGAIAGGNFYTFTAGYTAFYTGSSEKMRIDSSGNLGLGVTPSAWNTVTALQVRNGSFYGYSTDESGWQQNAYYASGWKYISTGNAASQYMQVGGTHRWYNAPSGTAGNAITFTQAMTLDTSGNLLVGTTSLYSGAGAKVSVSWNSSSEQGIALKTSSATFAGNAIIFLNNVNVASGFISQSLTTVTYNTTSDYRLKENIAPMQNALATVAALKPVTYTWKADGSDGQGFIAHELQAVVPDCVTGTKDAVDKDGKAQHQGVDTSFLVATLTAAIQEQQALIQNLTTRLTALEAI
jgi:hypothetical protein